MAKEIATLGIEVKTDGVRQANKDLDDLQKHGGKAESSMVSLGNAAKGAFAGFSVAALVGKLVGVQREFDVLNSSLVTITGSTKNAAKEFEWIKQFAAETPFALNEVTSAFVKMRSLGLDASKDALTSYGNTASAMGKSINQMIEAVADASTGEFERLKEFGIKAKQSGDSVSLTFQGVTTSIGNNAAEISKYLTNIGNNQFAGAMAERAKTLDGALSNLGDTWDELFRTINTNNAGGLIFDSVKLASSAIEDAIKVMNSMSDAAKDNASETGAMAAVQEGIGKVFETVAVLGLNVKYVLTQIGTELGGLAAQAAALAQLDFAAAKAIGEMMKSDAAAARVEVDAASARILAARSVVAKAASGDGSSGSSTSGKPTAPKATKVPKAKSGDENLGFDVTAAKAYESSISGIIGAQLAAEKSTLSLNGAQTALYDLMRSSEWDRMPEAWQQIAIAETAAATEAINAADQVKRLNDMLAATESAGIEKARSDMELLTKALNAGTISEQTYLEAATARLNLTAEKTKEVTNEMDEFAKSSAKNMQSSFADFFFDPFAKGTKSMGENFANILKRMLADAASAKILNALVGDGKSEKGLVGSIDWSKLFSGFGASSSGATGLASLGSSVNLDGFRAAGGSVGAGKNYLVGERGPEILRMGSGNGTVIPNNLISGGAVSVQINNYSGQSAQQKEVPDGRGGRRIEVTVGDMVAAEMRRSGSAANKALSQPRMVAR